MEMTKIITTATTARNWARMGKAAMLMIMDERNPKLTDFVNQLSVLFETKVHVPCLARVLK